MPIKLKKTNIQYDIDKPDEGYIILGFDESGNLVTKDENGVYEPIVSDVTTGNFTRLEVDFLTVGSRISGSVEGENSIAQGTNIESSGDASFSQGKGTVSSSSYSYSRGQYVTADGEYAHASGWAGNSTNRIFSSGKNSFVHLYSTSTTTPYGSLADYSAILGGVNHNIDSLANSSAIIGGTGNSVGSSVINSVVLGGQGQTAVDSNVVYAPRLALTNITPLSKSGSIYYDGSNFYGHNGSVAKRLDTDSVRSFTNGLNNRVLTATSATGINGESNLLFDGTTLSTTNISASGTISSTSTISASGNITTTSNIQGADIKATSDLIVTTSSGDINVGDALQYNTSYYITSHIYSSISGQNVARMSSAGDIEMLIDQGDDFKIINRDNTDEYTYIDAGGTGWARKYYYAPDATTVVQTLLFESDMTGDGSDRRFNLRMDQDSGAQYNTGWFYFSKDTGQGSSQNGWTSRSDRRLKTNITPFSGITEKYMNLEPVKFNWNYDTGGKTQLGLIAQDVDEYFPDIVSKDYWSHEDDFYYNISYDKISVLNISMIKELKTKIDQLEQRIYDLENPS